MIQDQVKEYYGLELKGSKDLKTNACCTDGALPAHIKKALSNVHDEVLSRYYGCGLIAPDSLDGCRILDLGSGSGRDVYVLAQLVGESGEVIGIDMTKEQISVAREYEEWHRDRFGYKKSNVKFIEGELEKISSLGLEKASFDIIISNCVINLCTDKEAVMAGAKELLKPGGEIYFSDVYSDRRVPEELRKDPVLYGECLSGALYINDFETMVKKIGFNDPRITESRILTVDNKEIEKAVGDIKFYSVTYRLFNLDGLEPYCEDYGQSVKYKGELEVSPNLFILDDHHSINRGEIFPVCGNTYRMLNESRFAKYFEFRGDKSNHYGIFAGCGGILSAVDSCCPPSPLGDESSCCSTPLSDSSSCCSTPVDNSSPVATIKSKEIKELWIHTGTNCNLSCEGCLEGAHPADSRIEMITFKEAKILIDEAVELGVSQLSFTGGEPFVNGEFLKILEYSLGFLPCLVLTNGTKPFHNNLDGIKGLISKGNRLSFRISLDSYDESKHDRVRGRGNFALALSAIKFLDDENIEVSIARRESPRENFGAVETAYKLVLTKAGISSDKRIIAFPDLLPPSANPDGIPKITENCLAPFNGVTGFMCETSRMAVKKAGEVTLYACTLVDDDKSYSLGSTIKESMENSIALTHHRCFSCYNDNASCSEL